MNVLPALLNNSAAKGEYGYHPKCRNIVITHLCFVDDIMVFTDGTVSSIEGVIKSFNKFEEMSELRINLDKISIYLAGVSTTARDTIVNRFNFNITSLPVRYLGLPLLTKRMTSANYNHLLEKLRQMITKWSVKFLSFVGLTNSSVQSSQVYLIFGAQLLDYQAVVCEK